MCALSRTSSFCITFHWVSTSRLVVDRSLNWQNVWIRDLEGIADAVSDDYELLLLLSNVSVIVTTFESTHHRHILTLLGLWWDVPCSISTTNPTCIRDATLPKYTKLRIDVHNKTQYYRLSWHVLLTRKSLLPCSWLKVYPKFMPSISTLLDVAFKEVEWLKILSKSMD